MHLAHHLRAAARQEVHLSPRHTPAVWTDRSDRVLLAARRTAGREHLPELPVCRHRTAGHGTRDRGELDRELCPDVGGRADPHHRRRCQAEAREEAVAGAGVDGDGADVRDTEVLGLGHGGLDQGPADAAATVVGGDAEVRDLDRLENSSHSVSRSGASSTLTLRSATADLLIRPSQGKHKTDGQRCTPMLPPRHRV